MKLDIVIFTCLDVTLAQREAPKLRGYFANKYNEITALHQHQADKYIYQYPKVQYKILDGKPTIIGINECTQLVKKLVLEENELQIENRQRECVQIELVQKSIIMHEHELTMVKEPIKYEFITPYMPLNQKNHKDYIKADIFQQEVILKKILIGNLLSFSKAMGYFLEEEVKVKLELSPITVKYKDNEMIGFKGVFYTNIDLPDLIGIGKSVSRGFGTIRKIK